MEENNIKDLEFLCSNFDIQFKKGKYRLILDADKDFTGENINELIEKAINYLKEPTKITITFKRGDVWIDAHKKKVEIIAMAKDDLHIKWLHDGVREIVSIGAFIEYFKRV